MIFCFSFLILFSTSASFAAFSLKDKKIPDSAVSNKPADEAVKEAMKELNSLSRHEKRSRIKEIKKRLKNTERKKEREAM